MSITGVSTLLGHASVAVTQQYYAQLTPKAVKDEFFATLGYRRV
jgi:integrase